MPNAPQKPTPPVDWKPSGLRIYPSGKTGARHHDPLESVICAGKRRIPMRWGEELEFTANAAHGDFIDAEAFVPHHEVNASAIKKTRRCGAAQRRRNCGGLGGDRADQKTRVGVPDRPGPTRRLT